MGTFVAMPDTIPAAGYARPRIGLLLDYVAPFAAFALHRLRRAYTGPLVKVRRSSDNTLADIGFVAATGELDETALLAFVGAGNGYVDTWYDQSGNSRHVSGALMPAGSATNGLRLVLAGVIERIGSHACINSLGTQMLSATAGADFMSMGGQVAITLLNAPAQAATNRLLAITSPGGTNPHLDPLGLNATGSGVWQFQSQDVTSQLVTAGVATAIPHVYTTVDTGTAVHARVDSKDGPPLDPYVRTNTGSPFTRFCLFGQHRANALGGIMTGKVAALIVLPPAEDDFEYIEKRLTKRAA